MLKDLIVNGSGIKFQFSDTDVSCDEIGWLYI